MRDFKRVTKSGDVFEIDGKLILVGDINRLGGVCDDCCEVYVPDTDNIIIGNIFESEEIFKRYKEQI